MGNSWKYFELFVSKNKLLYLIVELKLDNTFMNSNTLASIYEAM